MEDSYVGLHEGAAAIPDDSLHRAPTETPPERVRLRRTRSAASVTTSRVPSVQPDLGRQLQETDEALLGIALVTYLSQYRIQLKALAFFLVGAPILLLLATASYTFIAQRILMDFTALLALACLIAIGGVYSGLNRDEFLSRVTGTTPRWYSLNPDSVTTFLIVILPLMLALASRFPGGQVVFGWISSVIRSIPSQS
jgi:hypothetical protein